MPKIISTSEQVAFLEERYEHFKIAIYKFKKWFSSDQKIFSTTKIQMRLIAWN